MSSLSAITRLVARGSRRSASCLACCLDCTLQTSVLAATLSPAATACLGRLRHLKLAVRWSTNSRYNCTDPRLLTRCTGLRTLQLDWAPCFSLPSPSKWLASLVQLELTVVAGKAPDDVSWSALGALVHLRRLDLALRPIPNLDLLVSHLAALPHFATLELTVWPTEMGDARNSSPPFEVTSGLLAAMAQSVTFSSLHLHLSDRRKSESTVFYPWRLLDSDHHLRAAALDEPTRQRLRVHVHPTEGPVTIHHAGPNSWTED